MAAAEQQTPPRRRTQGPNRANSTNSNGVSLGSRYLNQVSGMIFRVGTLTRTGWSKTEIRIRPLPLLPISVRERQTSGTNATGTIARGWPTAIRKSLNLCDVRRLNERQGHLDPSKSSVCYVCHSTRASIVSLLANSNIQLRHH